MYGIFSSVRAAPLKRCTIAGLLAAASLLCGPAVAQTVAPGDAAQDSVPTVTIINPAPAVSATPGVPQLAVTPAAPAAPTADAAPAPARAPVPVAAPPVETRTEATTTPREKTAPVPADMDAATPEPPPLPPPTLSIDIDLTRQEMTVAANGAPLHTWQISSARYGYRTPTGTFRPTWMTKMWYSRQYDLAPMPHAIFFHKGVAIHGTYATRALGNPASHGCVRLALANAATLFKLVSRHGRDRTEIVVHGAPDHSTAGRVASSNSASREVVRFRRASPYQYLPPSYYARRTGAQRLYAAPRQAPRGLYSYGYGF